MHANRYVVIYRQTNAVVASQVSYLVAHHAAQGAEDKTHQLFDFSHCHDGQSESLFPKTATPKLTKMPRRVVLRLPTASVSDPVTSNACYKIALNLSPALSEKKRLGVVVKKKIRGAQFFLGNRRPTTAAQHVVAEWPPLACPLGCRDLDPRPDWV